MQESQEKQIRASCRALATCKLETSFSALVQPDNPFFFLLQVKHTQKRQKLHRINKVIKRKKQKTKKQTNSELIHLHGNTYKY